jgi:broad specificity phosphatase PhoE
LIQEDGLRETHHGHWEGMRQADVETRFQEEYAAWINQSPACLNVLDFKDPVRQNHIHDFHQEIQNG